ncbi:MAG: hypothetical protein FJ029_07170 [Actinobacteria bacterium]|nr:hypothetical protein [Actinomycetota bacterium]
MARLGRLWRAVVGARPGRRFVLLAGTPVLVATILGSMLGMRACGQMRLEAERAAAQRELGPLPPARISLTAAAPTLLADSGTGPWLYLELLDRLGRAAQRPEPTTVVLRSSDPTVAVVPATAVVPAGSSAVAVPLETTFVAKTITLTASVPGFPDASVDLKTVEAPDAPGLGAQLSLVVAPALLFDGGTGPATVTVSLLNSAGGAPIIAREDTRIALVSSDPAVVAVPAFVVIPAGAFAATADLAPGSPGSAAITALRSGFRTATASTAVRRPGSKPRGLRAVMAPNQVPTGSGTVARLVLQAVDVEGSPAP